MYLIFNSPSPRSIDLSRQDPRHTVQTTTCYVLEMFCENLQPETLRPFLNPLLTRLASLLQSPQKVYPLSRLLLPLRLLPSRPDLVT